jgi:cellulose synthase/poly-beta-1,6-N-acetylglucosamine synthase-like glycosyltransferase
MESFNKEFQTLFYIGKASDVIDEKDRLIYRFFEIFPGALSLSFLSLSILLSWLKPAWVAVFIISFVIYWFIRSVYLHFYLKSAYDQMRRYEKINWIDKLNSTNFNNNLGIKNWKDIYHLVVLPMYNEPLKIVRDTFVSLTKVNYPLDKIMVVLGCEESQRENVKELVKVIEKEFSNKFFKFLITWHPSNLPGEIPGHGSNEAWATKKAKEIIIDPLKLSYERIIVSSFDIDTQVFPEYFGCLTWHYLQSEKPTRTSFQPIPLYLNNIWEAPIFSQIFSFSASFWHTMNQERPEKLISFSSHAISFKALVDVGFKQTNVVSDDSRIFWQCFFYYNGDYRVQPIYYPVSMDANVSKNFFRTFVNVYKQQRRWAYGVVEIPYVLFGFIKNKKIPFFKKVRLSSELIFEHFSWATAPIMIFLLGWLPSIIGTKDFTEQVISYNLPRNISFILTVGMLGLVFSAHLSISLLPPIRLKLGKIKYVFFALGWLLVPLMMIIFSALPALDAQIRLMLGKYMGFWPTEKVRHH